MDKYVYIYYAGKGSEAGGSVDAWMKWFGELGDKLIDGGNPFDEGGKIVHQGGVMDPEGPAATGYSIVKAGSMSEANELAKGCPLLDTKDGAVGVYKALPM
jgi:hypothetical protein